MPVDGAQAVKAWQFSTDAFPRGQRQAAWREAMGRLRLPIHPDPAAEPFHGQVACVLSPMGIEFALVDSVPQEIAGRETDQPSAIWLGVMLSGRARLRAGRELVEVTPGMILYGVTGAPATLSFTSRFRALYIKAPRVALNPRLLAPMRVKLGCLDGASPIERVFFRLLEATAENLEDLSGDQLRPVELAVTEFLIACLAAHVDEAGKDGEAGAPDARLHRICQTIETLLRDPDLSLGQVADEHGVSPRYLQKLFTQAGQSFTGYLRQRRLERCRADLVSPLFAQLSISEICFRWSFNGSAHFSRAFRDQYGMSPREWRRSGQGG